VFGSLPERRNAVRITCDVVAHEHAGDERTLTLEDSERSFRKVRSNRRPLTPKHQQKSAKYTNQKATQTDTNNMPNKSAKVAVCRYVGISPKTC